MRNAVHNIARAALLLGIAVATQATAQDAGKGKRLYCWDENGHKVCGDALPASAAAAARTEISEKSGRTLETIARAMTPEERAAAALKAQQENDAARLRWQEQRRDLAMVESYATEADLRRAYADRTDLLDASIKTSVLSIGNLRQSLLSLLRQAADDELAGTPVPQPKLAELRNQHASLVKQQAILVQQRADRAQLDTELTSALQRYHDLKQGSAAALPAMPQATPAQ